MASPLPTLPLIWKTVTPVRRGVQWRRSADSIVSLLCTTTVAAKDHRHADVVQLMGRKWSIMWQVGQTHLLPSRGDVVSDQTASSDF